MAGPDPESFETLLSRRRSLLERVQHEPTPKPALVDEVALSRSTVDRAVRELESARLIDRTPEGIVLTLAGRVALERYRGYRSWLADLSRATDVIAPLPADAAFDPSLVADATVVTPEEHDPHRPAERLLRDLRAAHRIRAIAVTYHPEVVATTLERALDGDLAGEVVVTPGVLDVVVRRHSTEVDAARRAGLGLSSVAVPDAPYSLLLAERVGGTAVLVSVSRDGAVRGLIRTEGEPAVTWATRRFDRVRRDAESLRD